MNKVLDELVDEGFFLEMFLDIISFLGEEVNFGEGVDEEYVGNEIFVGESLVLFVVFLSGVIFIFNVGIFSGVEKVGSMGYSVSFIYGMSGY